MKQVDIHRHEIKYYINEIQAYELSLLLKTNMTPDPNGDATGCYLVRSMYFDTANNVDYYDKVIGYSKRKKIRLRIYNISTKTVKLEIKNKNNNYILKESINISREDSIKIIKGDYSILLNYNAAAANKVFVLMHTNLYRPKVIIDYTREAYTYPLQNLRITIDRHLHTTYTAYDLFSNNLCMIPVFYNNTSILEIKYDHMIPVFLQKVLSNFVVQKSQISKYCSSRNILSI